MFEAISYVLAVRFFLLLAVAGTFVLGWKVDNPWTAGAFAGFAVITVAMVLLEYRTRNK